MHVQKGLRKHASAEGIYFKVAHRLVSSLRCNPTQGIDTAPPICQWRPLSVHFWLSLISHKALPLTLRTRSEEDPEKLRATPCQS